MTDKVQKIREEVERLRSLHQIKYQNLDTNDNMCLVECGKRNLCNELLSFIDSLQKEPVSEDLNIESMIESYEQRLISQANGVKNSPLVDMCLASYKHGINETLDTLKLSNLVRTVKNRKESKFKVGDRIKFKGVRNEDVTRVITNIQKGDGGGFRYLFADGSIYSIDDDGIELVEEPVSKDLEEASKEWLKPQLDKSYADYGETKMMELTHFDGYAMLDAIEFGAKWHKQQMMKDAISAKVTEIYYPTDSCLEIEATLPEDRFKDEDKVLIIKED